MKDTKDTVTQCTVTQQQTPDTQETNSFARRRVPSRRVMSRILFLTLCVALVSLGCVSLTQASQLDLFPASSGLRHTPSSEDLNQQYEWAELIEDTVEADAEAEEEPFDTAMLEEEVAFGSEFSHLGSLGSAHFSDLLDRASSMTFAEDLVLEDVREDFRSFLEMNQEIEEQVEERVEEQVDVDATPKKTTTTTTKKPTTTTKKPAAAAAKKPAVAKKTTTTSTTKKSSGAKSKVAQLNRAAFKKSMLTARSWRGRDVGRKVLVGAGRAAGAAGKAAKTSGSTASKSGKAAGTSGSTATKSGKAAGTSGSTATKSGKAAGTSGSTATKSGKAAGTGGSTATKSGKAAGTGGSTATKSGKAAGTGGSTANKSGKAAGTGGSTAEKSGKAAGTKTKTKTTTKKDSSVALPPKKTSTTTSNAELMDKYDKLMSSGLTFGKQMTSDAKRLGLWGDDLYQAPLLPWASKTRVTRDSIMAGMRASGCTDAEVKKAMLTAQGSLIRGGSLGASTFYTGVSEQKGSCGSCWAHATVDALQRMQIQIGGELSRVPLAPQQILDCVRTKDSNGCSGGTPMDALDYLKSNPAATLDEYPSRGVVGTCKKSPFGGTRKPAYASYGWDMLIPACKDKTGPCTSQIQYELLMLEYMKQTRAVPIAYVDAENWQDHSSSVGLFDATKCKSTMEAGNHIVELIGFSTEVSSGVPYWILQNSWGADWGEQGRIRIPFGMNACGIANFVIQMIDKKPTSTSTVKKATGTTGTKLSAKAKDAATVANIKAVTEQAKVEQPKQITSFMDDPIYQMMIKSGQTSGGMG